MPLEVVKRKAEQLRTDLAGESPTPLEKLVVGQVVSCFMEMAHAQLKAAEPDGASPSQLAFNLRRLESAQRRYFAAIKLLATLRALVPEGLVPVNNSMKVYPAKQMLA
jgi:hypothetical protein